MTKSVAERIIDILNRWLKVEEVSASSGGELEYMVLQFEEGNIEGLAHDLLVLADEFAPEGVQAIVSEADGFKLGPLLFYRQPASALQGKEGEKR